jgi:hypothetical protein
LRTSRLGKIIVIPEALSREGFFPVGAHCNAQFEGHSSIRYRCVSPFISYNEDMIATSLDFRVLGVVVEIDAISQRNTRITRFGRAVPDEHIQLGRIRGHKQKSSGKSRAHRAIP